MPQPDWPRFEKDTGLRESLCRIPMFPLVHIALNVQAYPTLPLTSICLVLQWR